MLAIVEAHVNHGQNYLREDYMIFIASVVGRCVSFSDFQTVHRVEHVARWVPKTFSNTAEGI